MIDGVFLAGDEDYWNFIHCVGHNLLSRMSVPASLLYGIGWEVFELESGIVKKNRKGYCEVYEDLLVSNLTGQLSCNDGIANSVIRCFCVAIGEPPVKKGFPPALSPEVPKLGGFLEGLRKLVMAAVSQASK